MRNSLQKNIQGSPKLCKIIDFYKKFGPNYALNMMKETHMLKNMQTEYRMNPIQNLCTGADKTTLKCD